MNVSTEKHRRMALRRDVGNRAVQKKRVKPTDGSPYLIAHACFKCRKSFKITPREQAPPCPQCTSELNEMGRSFKAPAMRNVEQWQKVEALFNAGFRFFSYRSYPSAPKLPERFKEVAAFLRSNPKHPFKAKSPTNASKQARSARSTGKSLRASPALYAWR